MQTRLDPFDNQFTPADIASLQTSRSGEGAKAPTSSSLPAKKAKPKVEPKNGVTMTGEPADQVVINPNHDPMKITEETEEIKSPKNGKHAFIVGGFSPFTKAHHELVKHAQRNFEHVHVFTTQSKSRPIPADDKVKYIKKAVGSKVHVSTTQTPLHAASEVYKRGAKEATFVGGSDRKSIVDRVNQYNGKKGLHGEYHFDTPVKLHVFGSERKEGAEGLAGISGTKARAVKNPEELKKYIPTALHPHAEKIFKQIKVNENHMEDEKEIINENVTLQQRLRRGVTMKRYAKKLQRAREIARRRLAKKKQLRRRSLKQARSLVRQRVAGGRGQHYSKLSTSEKIALDRMADKRKRQIVGIATRIAPRIKRADVQRLAAVASGKRVVSQKIPVVSSMEYDIGSLLNEKAKQALQNKATQTGINFATIIEVYKRGLNEYVANDKTTAQQFAFARVNSFLANGKAREEDKDLIEQEGRRNVLYTARDMTNVDLEHLPSVLPQAYHEKHKAEIQQHEKDNPKLAARKKADIIRRMAAQYGTKVNEASVFKRVANKIVRRQSPQLAKMKTDLVAALKQKNFEGVADIVLYLFRHQLGGNVRLQQEDVCIPEDDYIHNEWTWEEWEKEVEYVTEAENENRTLNKPFRTPGGPKKFAVYVKNAKGNVIKLGFGDPNLEIKRDDPDRRKAYRARHGCDNPGPKWKANYWSCNWSWSASKKVGA